VPLVWLALQSLIVVTMYVWDVSDPRVWALALVEVIVILAVVPWRQRSLQMVRQFRAGYYRGLRQTRSPKAALTQELDIVASQAPFDVLSKDDLDMLAELFSPLPDPTVLPTSWRTHGVTATRQSRKIEPPCSVLPRNWPSSRRLPTARRYPPGQHPEARRLPTVV
jgi:hypothetical protein